jgi:hypothetical protein
MAYFFWLRHVHRISEFNAHWEPRFAFICKTLVLHCEKLPNVLRSLYEHLPPILFQAGLSTVERAFITITAAVTFHWQFA